jgi:hypothetical protein
LRNPFERVRSGWKNESPSHRISLILLFFAGAGMRLAYLFQPMCQDETITFLYLAWNPLSMLVKYYPDPNHHILHTILVHINTALLGTPEWAIRLPAFIAGLLIIPVAYLAGRRLFNRNVALLATAIVVPSSMLIEYSTNARGYSMQTLFFLLLVLAAISVKESGKLSSWAGFVVFAILGFYTIPTMLYFFSVVVAWLLVSFILRDCTAERGAAIKGLVLSCSVVAVVTSLLYTAPIINSGLSNIVSNTWVQPLPYSEFFGQFAGSLSSTWHSWNRDWPLAISILLGAGFLFSLLFFRRVSRHKVNMALVALLVSLISIVIQRVLPFDRVWLPLLPLYYIFASAGLCAAGRLAIDHGGAKWPRVPSPGSSLFLVTVLLLSCCLISLSVVNGSAYQPPDQVTFRDAEDAAIALKDELQPGDIVYSQNCIRKPLEYYFFRHRIPFSYLYRYPDDVDREIESVNRAFVIEAEEEGYPLSTTLEHSNLDLSSPHRFFVFEAFPCSSVLVEYNPDLAQDQERGE